MFLRSFRHISHDTRGARKNHVKKWSKFSRETHVRITWEFLIGKTMEKTRGVANALQIKKIVLLNYLFLYIIYY